MLLGGFFLYVSYYGCDQSQVQRELCGRSQAEAQQALWLNGLMRFPLVMLYCFVGVGIGVYAAGNESFVASLTGSSDSPNYNLAVPVYIINYMPVGIVGIALVALFAAAMSSLDSVINSLSATTMEDFVRRFHSEDNWSDARELLYSRGLTVVWGVITLWMAFHVDDIASTVLVAINKIGSLINGPVLGVFTLGLLTTRATGPGACVGLLAGFLLNLGCWQFLPDVSWLWWNVFGFITTVVVGLLVSSLGSRAAPIADLVWSLPGLVSLGFDGSWRNRYLTLGLWFLLLTGVLLAI